jgi:hypothetical protein
VASRIAEVAQKSMETGDSIQKTYSGRIDGKYGYLVITRKKILFLKEEGFFSKSYSIIYNLPFEKMNSFSLKDKYNLEFINSKDERKVFVSEIPADTIETSLKSIRDIGKISVPMT